MACWQSHIMTKSQDAVKLYVILGFFLPKGIREWRGLRPFCQVILENLLGPTLATYTVIVTRVWPPVNYLTIPKPLSSGHVQSYVYIHKVKNTLNTHTLTADTHNHGWGKRMSVPQSLTRVKEKRQQNKRMSAEWEVVRGWSCRAVGCKRREESYDLKENTQECTFIELFVVFRKKQKHMSTKYKTKSSESMGTSAWSSFFFSPFIPPLLSPTLAHCTLHNLQTPPSASLPFFTHLTSLFSLFLRPFFLPPPPQSSCRA